MSGSQKRSRQRALEHRARRAREAAAASNEATGVREPEAPDRASRRTLLVAALFVLAMLVVFGSLGYRGFTRRLDAAKKMDRAIELVTASDKLVVEIDGVVRAPASRTLAEKARGAEQRVKSIDQMLVEAQKLMDVDQNVLTEDEVKKAKLVGDCASARRAMLAAAPVLLEANAQASSALPLAKEGWAALLKASAISERAVASYNKLTKTGVRDAQRLTGEAVTQLTFARERFQAAEAAFPSAPFEDYIAYVDLRDDLAADSQKSNAAWLEGKTERADSLIAAYNRDDKAAVKAAKELPLSPAKAVSDAYSQMTSTATAAYYRARSRALEADKRMRRY